ncbi:Signal recognition particle receptor FtsY [Vibrio stylophorae]|uniref:Flagellar biosynthesis protein FlhF n=2 Tax=Vibrio stylophorae TaxID=659351 RepID=A0ABN8DU42_9VIBR|nr:Signal recognition particle receptor FtsY [Vibrio stylophorae]
MRTALAEVKEELGPDAVIMSNKRVTGGVEIVAAVDNEPAAPSVQKQQAEAQLDRGYSSARRKLLDDQVQLSQRSMRQSQSAPSHGNSRFAGMLDQMQQTSPRHEETEADSLAALLERQQRQQGGGRAPAPRRQAQDDRYDLTRSKEQRHQKAQETFNRGQERRARHDDSPMRRREQQPDELTTMRQEMASIRSLLEHQLSGLMWQEVERKEPLRALLIKRLQRMGLSEELADQLASYIPEVMTPHEAWPTLMEMLSDQILTLDECIIETGGVVALLGPTGVGKTTTIAKLAARAAMEHGPDEVALVTTDTYRIGAHEQLATYGRIMGCTVKVAKDADELADILYQLRHRRLVLVDTAGMGQRDIRLSEQLDTLMMNSGAKIKSFLVLPATAQRRVLQETIDHFRRIPLSGCVLTKLDESLSLGELLCVTIRNALPVAYLADGQRVPEDIKPATGQNLVSRAEKLLEYDLEQQTHFWGNDPSDYSVADSYD